MANFLKIILGFLALFCLCFLLTTATESSSQPKRLDEIVAINTLINKVLKKKLRAPIRLEVNESDVFSARNIEFRNDSTSAYILEETDFKKVGNKLIFSPVVKISTGFDLNSVKLRIPDFDFCAEQYLILEQEKSSCLENDVIGMHSSAKALRIDVEELVLKMTIALDYNKIPCQVVLDSFKSGDVVDRVKIDVVEEKKMWGFVKVFGWGSKAAKFLVKHLPQFLIKKPLQKAFDKFDCESFEFLQN